MDKIYCKCWQIVGNRSIDLHHVIMTVINGVGLIYTVRVHITKYFHITTATVTTVEYMGEEFPPYAQSAIYFSIDTETFKENVDCASLTMNPKTEAKGPVTTTRVITNTGWKFGDDFSQTGSDTIKIAGDSPESEFVTPNGSSEFGGWFGLEPEAMVGRQLSINGMITDDSEDGKLPFSGSFFLRGSKVVTEQTGCAYRYQNMVPDASDSRGRVQMLMCENS